MRRVLLLLVGICALTQPAQAQLACGPIDVENVSHQLPDLKYVEFFVRTMRPVSICPAEVQSEGWVDGVKMTAMKTRGNYFAQVHGRVAVPSFRTYTVYGKHWLIQWGIPEFTWHARATTVSHVTVEKTEYMRCLERGGYFDGQQCVMPNTPILIDTGNDGYRLTSPEEGVLFDLNADGHLQQVAWTEPGSNDCWLAMDRNGNGRIDNGSELFGNHTPAYADRAAPTASDGFMALSFLETPGYGSTYPDDVIDARDEAYGRLLLWCDANHNGISEPEELRSVADAGYTAFGTQAKEVGRRDRHGNLYRLKGKATGPFGEQPIWDVYLQTVE